MLKYIGKRLLQAIPMMIAISILVFAMMQLSGYDPVDAITTPDMDPAVVNQLKEHYGYDKPPVEQYLVWAKNALRGDFGYSIQSSKSIKSELATRIPNSMKLLIPAYFTAFILAILIGSLSGYYRNGWFDKLSDGLCSLAIATPNFWFAILLMYLFGLKLKLLPIVGMHTVGDGSFSDFLKHFILPYTVMVVAYLPQLTRYVRSSTISQTGQDYVLVQKAYGATNGQILSKHILKNSLLPLVTQLGIMLPYLITGSIIVESIFSWPGVGSYYVKAITTSDYGVVMSILLLSSFLVILGSLLSDALYSLIDPRIREGGNNGK